MERNRIIQDLAILHLLPFFKISVYFYLNYLHAFSLNLSGSALFYVCDDE